MYTLRFFSSKSVCFIILTYLVPVLFTFYIHDVLTFKKNNSGAKSLIGAGIELSTNNCELSCPMFPSYIKKSFVIPYSSFYENGK